MMKPCNRDPLVLMLLVFSLVAASSAPAERPPVFLLEWGGLGTGDGQFEWPKGLAVDASGNVYVADSENDRIQKFDSNGTFLTEWGNYGTDESEFYRPEGVAIDALGNVYVTDHNRHRIQKFDSNGAFFRTWGWGVRDGSAEFQVCLSGCREGIAGPGSGQFDRPSDVAVDAAGNVYVPDWVNDRIQKFDSYGAFLTEWGTQGSGDGQFDWPWGVAVDASGNVYVAELYNHRIQKFDSNGSFLTKWGTYGTGDGEFRSPCGLAVYAPGYVYVADVENNRIQKFLDSSVELFVGEPELPSGRR